MVYRCAATRPRAIHWPCSERCMVFWQRALTQQKNQSPVAKCWKETGKNITLKIHPVHAALLLVASEVQANCDIIVRNLFPKIFIVACVAMGVRWGTVVAAESVAAEPGEGMMIILVGITGFGIDLLMRWAERILFPCKDKV